MSTSESSKDATMSTSESSKDNGNPEGKPVLTEVGPSGSAEKPSEVGNNASRGQNKVEESDEDIPGDFFDDFLKEDFMAGLDIVDDDEWDEDKMKNDVQATEESKKDVDSSLNKKETEISRKRKKPASKNSDANKAPALKGRRSRQRKKKLEEKGNEAKQKKSDKKNLEKKNSDKKISDKPIDADDFDIRRDPEKTKRDIARDKVRCEKDKEMKIISEKLNLVETGLVPPGMEMEIDMEEVKKQKEKMENKSPRDLREHLKNLKGRNKSPVNKPKSPVRRRSPPRKSPNSTPLRKRSRSPRREPLTLTRGTLSPLRRSPRRSPLRRSPRRFSPLRNRSSERAFGRRRSRSHSPFYRGRRVKYSPLRRRDRSTSRESDREKWLKRRNRSRSPRRKRDEKKSFLQEIAEKLNELRQPIMVPHLQPMPPGQPMLQTMPPTLRYVEPQSLSMPVPVPTPVPAPAPIPVPAFPPPQQQQYDPYDQSFFIGTPQAVPNNFLPRPRASPLPGAPQPSVTPISTQPMRPPIVPVNPTSSTVRISTQTKLDQVPKKQPKQKLETQEDIAKLFQDKQISLSEFLATTAKPEVFSSSPIHVQEKIKVITRCHEAIKFLESSEKKYSGRLVVHKTDKYNVTPGKHLSPLKYSPPVQFAFTNPAISVEEQKSSFTRFINDMLQKLGLLKDTVVNVDDEETDAPAVAANKPAPNFSPPPPPLITPIKNPVPHTANNTRYKDLVRSNRLPKMVQTDPFKCETCEKRNKIVYRSTAMQATSMPVTFSISTQVTEEDFQPKIPKTKSLAALTPAQLLAKSRESLNAATRGGRIDVDSFDIHPTGFNRPNYFRGNDNYGLGRPNPPFGNPSSVYDDLDSHMYEGGGRGREPYPPRMLDPNARFNHTNYY